MPSTYTEMPDSAQRVIQKGVACKEFQQNCSFPHGTCDLRMAEHEFSWSCQCVFSLWVTKSDASMRVRSASNQGLVEGCHCGGHDDQHEWEPPDLGMLPLSRLH